MSKKEDDAAEGEEVEDSVCFYHDSQFLDWIDGINGLLEKYGIRVSCDDTPDNVEYLECVIKKLDEN